MSISSHSRAAPGGRREGDHGTGGRNRTGRRPACAMSKAGRDRSRHVSPAVPRKRIREIAETRVRYSYRRIRVPLRCEGWPVDAKRIYRVYCNEWLQLRNKTPKRKVSAKLREDRCRPRRRMRCRRRTPCRTSCLTIVEADETRPWIPHVQQDGKFSQTEAPQFISSLTAFAPICSCEMRLSQATDSPMALSKQSKSGMWEQQHRGHQMTLPLRVSHCHCWMNS